MLQTLLSGCLAVRFDDYLKSMGKLGLKPELYFCSENYEQNGLEWTAMHHGWVLVPYADPVTLNGLTVYWLSAEVMETIMNDWKKFPDSPFYTRFPWKDKNGEYIAYNRSGKISYVRSRG